MKLKTTLLLLGAATLACTSPSPVGPNVLLIVIDTLRADHLGCYGDKRDISPTIDSLAADGILFEDSWSYSDYTRFSHAALFASQWVRSEELNSHQGQVLAEVFKNSGYRTYGVSANPGVREQSGFDRGFDRYNSDPIPAQLAAATQDPNRRNELRTAQATNQAVFEMLERHHSQEQGPWFMFINYLDPHDPYTKRLPWSDVFRTSGSEISGTLRPEGMTLFEWNARVAPTLTMGDRERLADLYAAEVRFTDEHLGRLLDHLSDLGWRENTVIAITSDHGELLGEHGVFTHAQGGYEAELAVPLIFWSPKFRYRGTRPAVTAEGVDVAPTLLSLSGIEVPDTFKGISLLSPFGRPIQHKKTFTRHYHSAKAADQRRELGFPVEHTSNSHIFRFFDGRKLYLFEDQPAQLIDVAGYPNRIVLDDAEGFAELQDWAHSLVGSGDESTPTTLDPSTEEALRSLGYIQ